MKKLWHFCHEQPATTFIEKYDNKWHIRTIDDRIPIKPDPQIITRCPYCKEELK